MTTNSKSNITVCNIYNKKENHNSGTFMNNQWIVRSFNKIVGNAPIKLNSTGTVFTVKPGNYLINAKLPAYSVGNHQARLFNITDNSVAKYGSSEIAPVGSQTSSLITYYTGILDKSTKFKIEHQAELLQINNGLGINSGFSDSDQICGEIQIIKLDI